jgi:tetratricopeptide (TPR) repeat protein
MGLLKAEQDDPEAAERHLRTALKTDPNFPEAAYNLGVLIANKYPEEGISWCRKAYNARPQETKYAYTLAFYLQQKGQLDEAADILEKLIEQQSNFTDAALLLRAVYEKQKTLDQQ